MLFPSRMLPEYCKLWNRSSSKWARLDFLKVHDQTRRCRVWMLSTRAYSRRLKCRLHLARARFVGQCTYLGGLTELLVEKCQTGLGFQMRFSVARTERALCSSVWRFWSTRTNSSVHCPPSNRMSARAPLENTHAAQPLACVGPGTRPAAWGPRLRPRPNITGSSVMWKMSILDGS